MAKVIRYFSPTSAGIGDGTSWANRAAFPASASIISTFDHTADTLEARFGPGVYTITTAITSSASVTSTNKCVLHGCDSSGNLLPGQNGWVSSQGDFDYSSYPIFDGTGNWRIFDGAFCLRCLTIRASGSGARTNALVNNIREYQWVTLDITTTTSSAWNILTLGATWRDCQIIIPSATFSAVFGTSNSARFLNCRFRTSSILGTRNCIATANINTSLMIIGCFFSGFNQAIRNGAGFSSATVTQIRNNTIVNCVDGISQESTQALSTNTSQYIVDSNYVANCSGYGIRQLTFDYATAQNNRVRDCAGGLLVNFDAEFDNILTSGTDADEFVNSAGGDYRIKAGSAIWGLGIGAGDQPSSSGSSGIPIGRLISGGV